MSEVLGDGHPVTDAIHTALTQLDELSTSSGHMDPDRDDGFAVDLYNPILADLGGQDPYLFGTGYLPSRADAEAFAALVVPLLNAFALDACRYDPGSWNAAGWSDRTQVAVSSHAIIVSAARTAEGVPVTTERFHEGEPSGAADSAGCRDRRLAGGFDVVPAA